MPWEYADYEYSLSALVLIFAMFGMGNTLTPREFVQVARSPQSILLIVGLQVLVTPLVAVALTRVFSVPDSVAVGLLVVSALPGGMFSNVITNLGRGNVALSVSATAVCSLCCLATTTFILRTFASAQLPADFAMPAKHILSEIAFFLLLPLAAGMVFRRLWPQHCRTSARLSIRASTIMLAIFIIGALSAGRIDLREFGWQSPLAVIVLQVLMIWVSYGCGFLLRLPINDTFTVAIEVVVRNAHLGVLLKSTLFPARQANEIGDGVLFVVLLYGGASLAVGGIEVFTNRRRNSRRERASDFTGSGVNP